VRGCEGVGGGSEGGEGTRERGEGRGAREGAKDERKYVCLPVTVACATTSNAF